MVLQLIYKILTHALWQDMLAQQSLHGAPVDLADGFIHFSTAEQVSETAAKHFAGQSQLMLLAVDAAGLGAALRWETSRNQALFPHLYGTLAMADVLWSKPLPLTAQGTHDFSRLLA